ncbi:MAG: DUF3971 domain-containing protein [Cyanobacteria bacterium SIG32]|nr:DUF3971 domain-containing protein [Cyanobacteria bacterium SIG32]
MNIKRFGIITGCIVGSIYLIFLLLPLILSPILNSYVPKINTMAQELTGFKIKLENLKVITTPKLTAGLKIGSIDVSLPTNEQIVKVDNFNIKLGLLPIFIGKIELDSVGCDLASATLQVQKDGHFYIEEFLPKADPDKTESIQQPVTGLPLGIKLSNKLPNISAKNYNLTFVDMGTQKQYSLFGKDLKITDFVLDKKIKISTNGAITLDNTKPFNFDIKIFNRLMPNLNLHELVFTPQVASQPTQATVQNFNIIDIFKGLQKTQLTADFKTDIETSGSFASPIINGFATIDKISMLVDDKKLPESNIQFKAKGNNLDLDMNLYSTNDEKTTLVGKFKTGKNANIDMNFISNAQINNIFRIINSIAKSFNFNDLETLTATGAIDANFSIKSDLNKLNTEGYFKIPSANIAYKLYNIAIEKINADIDFTNMLNIKNISFEIFDQPLKTYGTIQKNSETDIHILADKLSIKGLVAAAGQIQLLKENNFNSGSISLDAALKGKLTSIIPSINFSINNLDIKNNPTDTRITMPVATLKINNNNNKFIGDLNANNFQIFNPLATIALPNANIEINEQDIIIKEAYLLFNKSRIDIIGKITNYITEKLAIDIKAQGNILATDLKNMIPKEMQYMVSGTGQMPLSATINGNLKSQDIGINITANPKNYFSLLDIDALRGKSTIINSNIKISDDSAKFTNTVIYVNDLNTPIAKLDGSINKLSQTQNLDLKLSVPNKINFVIPGFKKSNLAIKGDISIIGTALNPILKGFITIPTITMPEMDLTMTNLVANLNGPIMLGNGTLQTFQFGGIVANNLATQFALKNYETFYLTNLVGDTFDGKISGDISYGIMNGKTTVNLKGSNMNALKAIEGAAGIKNALSGTLGFNCNIATQGATDIDIMKNLTGKVTFDINNGKFLNIGRFDNLLYAQNILGNAILKTAVTAITNTPLVQNTAEFKDIKGELTFSNGWADIKSITSSGPLMSYYINGKYNLLNATTNVIILGRLDSKVVSILGPLGDLSVDKLTSYIPKFGALTAMLIDSMTTDPAKENTEFLPALTTGSEEYKDFKVEFNGGIDSTSSVKSFKWLSNCDTSAINIKDDFNNTVNAVKQDFEATKDALKNSLQDSKQQLLDAKEELKNLFKF